jgi:hypothetical protein
MPNDTDWLIMGDFNFIRNPNDRNKPGGNITEMLQFNEAISNLGLVEIPFKGKKIHMEQYASRYPARKT